MSNSLNPPPSLPSNPTPQPSVDGHPSQPVHSFKSRQSPHLPALKEAAPLAKKISDACPDAGVGKDRRFVCTHDKCNEGFTRRYNLKVHVRTHTKEKPYICPLETCGKRYKWRSSLAHHVERFHRKETEDMIKEIEQEELAYRTAGLAINDKKEKGNVKIKNNTTKKAPKKKNGMRNKKVTTFQQTGNNLGVINPQDPGAYQETCKLQHVAKQVGVESDMWVIDFGDWESTVNGSFMNMHHGSGSKEGKDGSQAEPAAGNSVVKESGGKQGKRTRKSGKVLRSKKNVDKGGLEVVMMSPVSSKEETQAMETVPSFHVDGKEVGVLSMGEMDFDAGIPGGQLAVMQSMTMLQGVQYDEGSAGPDCMRVSVEGYPPFAMSHFEVGDEKE